MMVSHLVMDGRSTRADATGVHVTPKISGVKVQYNHDGLA